MASHDPAAANPLGRSAEMDPTLRVIEKLAAMGVSSEGIPGQPLATVTVYRIARCPEHGLHGQRSECFVCGGEVEQVEMVPLSTPSVEARNALAEAMFRVRYSDPYEDGVDRAWTKVEDASGYEASMLLGILHGMGFDVVRRRDV